MPNYNVNLDSPSELVTIVEDMIDDREDEVRKVLETDNEALEERVDELTSDCEKLEEELEYARETIDDLKERISELETEQYE